MSTSKDNEAFLSDIHHALRATRRRRIIRSLREADDDRMSTRALARNITAQEQGIPVCNATGEAYRNAYNALSQTHLPTLSEAGIIIYDPDRQTVDPGRYFAVAALLVATNGPAVTVLRELIQSADPLGHEPAMTD